MSPSGPDVVDAHSLNRWPPRGIDLDGLTNGALGFGKNPGADIDAGRNGIDVDLRPSQDKAPAGQRRQRGPSGHDP